MTFADRLKMVMELQGISQRELAERTGLEESHVSHFATGRREPSLANFAKIVRALKIPAEMLIPDES